MDVTINRESSFQIIDEITQLQEQLRLKQKK